MAEVCVITAYAHPLGRGQRPRMLWHIHNAALLAWCEEYDVRPQAATLDLTDAMVKSTSEAAWRPLGAGVEISYRRMSENLFRLFLFRHGGALAYLTQADFDAAVSSNQGNATCPTPITAS